MNYENCSLKCQLISPKPPEDKQLETNPPRCFNTEYALLGRYQSFNLKRALGRAYQKGGEIDKAIKVYESLIKFDPDSKELFLIHPKYHYSLAKLYEEKGRNSKAIEQYEIFLEQWKDADEGLPEVEDAQKRLEALKN